MRRVAVMRLARDLAMIMRGARSSMERSTAIRNSVSYNDAMNASAFTRGKSDWERCLARAVQIQPVGVIQWTPRINPLQKGKTPPAPKRLRVMV